MKEDIAQIKSSNDVFIFADKTNNLYKSWPEEYKKLLSKNITKSYRKATERLEKAINIEAKYISKKLERANRIECLAKYPAFISVKNHKPNFQSSLPCRLINPSKSDIGKISKSILDRGNENLRKKLQFNPWKKSENIIDWFKKIENKSNYVFIKFDIAEFYPSVSETILRTAIRFAEEHVEIADEEKRKIFHCQKPLLFYKNEPWKKKDSDSCFHVTMGSYNGAELCEFIGIYLLSQLCTIISKNDFRLYRDRGLMMQKYINGQQKDQLRKKIMKTFKETGFKIDIETNLKVVNFLDMTFNLMNDSCKPYKKSNNTLLYINKISNHPPQIIKKLSKTINDRLCRNSSNAEILNASKIEYEAALKYSGYKNVDFKYNLVNKNNNKQNRQRNIL